MNHQDKVELKKCRNVLIQSNDPRINYDILKKEDIEDNCFEAKSRKRYWEKRNVD